jgi:protein-tyrosine phosphatase
MTPLWRKTQRQPVADLHWATSDLALWRGPNTQEWKAIRSTGIDCVLDLRAEVESQSDLASVHGITYRQTGIKEFTAPSPEVLAAEAGWVHDNIEAGRRVLVVCREGRGRSAMVCCAALV